ncbi:MAG: apolipoprotein N-acyltransferase [Gammaproteobacteria bacterium]
MALLSKINNQNLVTNYLAPFIFGAINFLSFAPFDLKFLIIVSYGYIAFLFNNYLSYSTLFIRLFMWGFAFWIFGTGWLIVSIYYYGNLTIILSLISIILLSSFLAVVFICPLVFFKNFISNSHTRMRGLVFASCLLTLDLLRHFLFGGFPWLFPGLITIDTFYQGGIPFIGIIGMSFFIYYVTFFFVNNLVRGSGIKIIIFIILFSLSYVDTPTKKNLENKIDVNLVQPAIDLNTKYSLQSSEDILAILFRYSVHQPKILNIWPETPFPFDSSHPAMDKVREYLIENDISVIGGSWRFEEGKLYNTLEIYNNGEHYKKRHLVPFGEFIPLSSLFKGLFDILGLPMSYISKGTDLKELEINGHKFISAICFDIAYPFSYINLDNSYEFIVNISNDTWFGGSYGPSQHFQITRARAIELDKFILRATNDGISAIIDNNGTVVDKIEKGLAGNLIGSIYTSPDKSFYSRIGWWLSLLIPCFIMFLTIFKRNKIDI